MLNRNEALLLVVDIQGKLAEIMEGRDLLFQNVIKLIKGIKILNIPIIWIEQNPQRMGQTTPCIKAELENLTPVPKMSFSCLAEPAIKEKIQNYGKRNIILCGIETHVCIFQTAADLINSNYHVYVPADAVSSRTITNKTIGIERIKNTGGIVTSVEMCLFEMLRSASDPCFKDILNIVK
mgnify:CR=1 FL=1